MTPQQAAVAGFTAGELGALERLAQAYREELDRLPEDAGLRPTFELMLRTLETAGESPPRP